MRDIVNKTVIYFSDYKAPIQVVPQPNSSRTTECPKLIHSLHNEDKVIALQLILSHCGISNSETTDFLAN